MTTSHSSLPIHRAERLNAHKFLDDVQGWMRWRKKYCSETDQQSWDAIYPRSKWKLYQETQLDQWSASKDWDSCCQTTLALSSKKSPKRKERTSSFGHIVLKSHSSNVSLDAHFFSSSVLPPFPFILLSQSCSLVHESSSGVLFPCTHTALVQVRQDLTYSRFPWSFLQRKECRLWQKVLDLDPDFTYQLAVWFI